MSEQWTQVYGHTEGTYRRFEGTQYDTVQKCSPMGDHLRVHIHSAISFALIFMTFPSILTDGGQS